MGNLEGRKLLVLGATVAEIEIVRCAQGMGAFVVTTDNHEDWSLAPAKASSDEAWDVSWSDIESLAELAERSGIDGVLAGFSERRVACAQALAERLGKPFYADGADLGAIMHKGRFKEACAAAGVDVARSFDRDGDVELPVIVKPSDNGGSRGITVCRRPGDLERAYDLALANSDEGSVEIEEYIVADEAMVYYVVYDGEPVLSAMCDRYMRSFDERVTQLPVGYRFPSKHLGMFRERHDGRFKGLISGLGVRNGLIAFQSFVIGDRVVPFDPTFRLDGTMAYRSTSVSNGSNALEMLVEHSLTGSMGGDPDKERPGMDGGIYFEVPILLGPGTISRVSGMDAVRAVDGVHFVHQRLGVGDAMCSAADFSQIFCRIQLRADDERDLAAKLAAVFDAVGVFDEEGRDMVLYRDWKSLASGSVAR